MEMLMLAERARGRKNIVAQSGHKKKMTFKRKRKKRRAHSQGPRNLIALGPTDRTCGEKGGAPPRAANRKGRGASVQPKKDSRL